MPNVTIANFNAANDVKLVGWKWSRCMKLAGWKVLASSTGFSGTVDITGDPSADKWGGGGTVQSGTGATVSAVANGRATIVGLSGMATTGGLNTTGGGSGSIGRFLTLAGGVSANNGTFQITKWISATSVQIDNINAVVSATAQTWTEKDPLLDSYTIANNAWVLLQGPSILKIPITSYQAQGPLNFLIRGEGVTESGTGAKGELLSYYWNPATSLGYMVVAPRVRGTGAGRGGWATDAQTITGEISGAVQAVANPHTPVEVVQEFVMNWTTTSVWAAYGIFDAVGEATDRFSYGPRLAACTATVAPGQAFSGANTFPTHAFTCVSHNTNGSYVYPWGNSAVTAGAIQYLCVNAIPDLGVSADGTTTMLVGQPGINNGALFPVSIGRLDNTEEGDVSPYAVYWPNGDAFTAPIRTTSSGPFSVVGDHGSLTQTTVSGYFTTTFTRAWRNRLFFVNDAFNAYYPGLLAYGYPSTSYAFCLGASPGDAEKISHAETATRVSELIWVLNVGAGARHRKGTWRWLRAAQGGNGTDTFDGRKWIICSSNSNPAVIAGPWDGVSSPANA